jgi:coronin-1B/1C/6
MSKFVRASKVRHLFCQPDKKEETFFGLDLATTTGDHNYIKANSKFFATATRAGGGGAMVVVPVKNVGKFNNKQPKITGHTGAIFDCDFNPFHDQLLATGSDDCSCKIWGIPSEDGLTENLTDPLVDLNSHMKKVTFTQFHPCANNVLATGSADHTVKLWDIDAGEEKQTLQCIDNLQDMQWSYTGDRIAVSCKDKSMRIFDPRTEEAVQTCKPHEGSKCFKTCWLGQSNNIATVGFTRQSKRQFMIWDSRDLSKAIHTESLDQSAGVIMPFYDEDSHVLYLAGKGDGNIRFYEMIPEKPHCFSLSEYRGSGSQKGMCFIPKRHCDTTKCEVMRGYKLTSKTVEPLSFIIPRKSDRFQADIYPDTKAGVPALEAEAFFGGATDFTPKLVSMDPKNANKAASGETKQSMPSAVKSKAQLQKELDAALAKIVELEAKVAELSK